jgi:hypothetical protein
MKKAKKQKFDILSPDGFSIFPGRTYTTDEEIEKGLEEWKERFKTQGYYSTCRHGQREQIALEDLADECSLQLL